MMRADDVERHRLVGAADDLLGRQHQIDDADQRHQGAALDHSVTLLIQGGRKRRTACGRIT